MKIDAIKISGAEATVKVTIGLAFNITLDRVGAIDAIMARAASHLAERDGLQIDDIESIEVIGLAAPPSQGKLEKADTALMSQRALRAITDIISRSEPPMGVPEPEWTEAQDALHALGNDTDAIVTDDVTLWKGTP